MLRYGWAIAGLGGLGFLLLTVVACAPFPAAPAVGEQTAAAASCAHPTPEKAAECAALAEKILASTVRLEFHGPGGGGGHATVIGGRYLVTHNHYPVSWEALSRGEEGLDMTVSVSRANGDVVLLNAPLTLLSVTYIASEAVVLDFHEYRGDGFFEKAGIPSVEPGRWSSLNLQPGTEVAQVDGDLTATRLVWTKVAAVRAAEATPYLELDSFVEHGASGGGVFYNGVHIANNWSRNTRSLISTGEVLRQYSVAALDDESIVRLGEGTPDVALADR